MIKRLIVMCFALLAGLCLHAQQHFSGPKLYLNPSIENSDFLMPIRLALVWEQLDGNQFELHLGPLRWNVSSEDEARYRDLRFGVAGQYNIFILKEFDWPVEPFIAIRAGTDYGNYKVEAWTAHREVIHYGTARAYCSGLVGAQKSFGRHLYLDASMNLATAQFLYEHTRIVDPLPGQDKISTSGSLQYQVFPFLEGLNLGIGWRF